LLRIVAALVVPTLASSAVASDAVSLLSVVNWDTTVESSPRLSNWGSLATKEVNELAILGVSAVIELVIVEASAAANAAEEVVALVVEEIAVARFSPAISTSNAPRASPLNAVRALLNEEILVRIVEMSLSTADAD